MTNRERNALIEFAREQGYTGNAGGYIRDPAGLTVAQGWDGALRFRLVALRRQALRSATTWQSLTELRDAYDRGYRLVFAGAPATAAERVLSCMVERWVASI